MSYKNTTRAIILPLAIGLALAAGVVIGIFFTPNVENTSIIKGKDSGKIDAVIDFVKTNYVDKITEDELVEITISSMLSELDPHSVYIPAEDLKKTREHLQGNFEGIGVQFNIQNDTIVVISTISGGPSEKVGIQAGDRIVTINDSVFAGNNIENEDVIDNLKGKKGTTVKVGITRRGYPELLYFTIERDEIPLYSVDVSYMVNKELGYIKISKFSATTAQEFNKAVDKLKTLGMKKIILDLRSNGGGYLDAAIKVSDHFLKDQKMIVYTKGHNRPVTNYFATDKGDLLETEVIVMIDSWSASASEIVAGAVQDNDRGLILGQRSYGKGLVQEPVRLTDGSAIRLTVARYYSPTGRCIQKPYDNNEEYEKDILNRFEHGEFMEKDSIQFPDSLKYTTPGGKTVYGGGGIMPDIFVPRDTSGYTKYLAKLINKGLIYSYAFKFTDNHRDVLSQLKTVDKIEAFMDKKDIFQQFIAYAKNEGVVAEEGDLEVSGKIIQTRLKAYVARNIIDNDGFYPIIHRIDNTFQRAVKEMKQ